MIDQSQSTNDQTNESSDISTTQIDGELPTYNDIDFTEEFTSPPNETLPAMFIKTKIPIPNSTSYVAAQKIHPSQSFNSKGCCWLCLHTSARKRIHRNGNKAKTKKSTIEKVRDLNNQNSKKPQKKIKFQTVDFLTFVKNGNFVPFEQI